MELNLSINNQFVKEITQNINQRIQTVEQQAIYTTSSQTHHSSQYGDNISSSDESEDQDGQSSFVDPS